MRTIYSRISKKVSEKLHIPSLFSDIFSTIIVKLIDLIVLILVFFDRNKTIKEKNYYEILSNYYLNKKKYHFERKNSKWGTKVTKKISIIIPCYNSEKTIVRCIDSLIGLSDNPEIEILIVNDGSIDDTLLELEKMNLASNFKVINQENKGHSGARNTGILNSEGRYIFFLDADDTMDISNIHKIILELDNNKYDILDFSYNLIDKYGKSSLQSCYEIDTDNFFSEFDYGKITGYPWGKFYKRELWECTEFPEGFWYEDTMLLYSIFPNVKAYKKFSFPVVNYYYNEEGITQKSIGQKKTLDSLYIVEYLLDEYLSQHESTAQKLKEITTIQLSSVLYRRIKYLEKDIQIAAFEQAAKNMSKYNMIFETKNLIYKEIFSSYKMKNYEKWKKISKVL